MIAETLGWARLMRGAGEIVDRLESYTEVSPSGTRLHVLVEGRVPECGNPNGDVEHALVETLPIHL